MIKIAATIGKRYSGPRDHHFLTLCVKENGPKNESEIFPWTTAFGLPVINVHFETLSDAVKVISIRQIPSTAFTRKYA